MKNKVTLTYPSTEPFKFTVKIEFDNENNKRAVSQGISAVGTKAINDRLALLDRVITRELEIFELRILSAMDS